ncbi:hypothetical protein [Flavobacterium luteolum]|uniref:hypothetical protein n=1 Tax=Flavobacterium luteolum TaxID=3003259 RepID=UPI00248E5508|nr:hypothetical protein [Flavobacterium luteolum]
MAHTEVIKSAIEINGDPSSVFVYVFEHDLLYFFKGLPNVPNFTYRPFERGTIRPGFEHMIYFADGSTAKRKLTAFLPEMSFTVVVRQLDIFFLPGLQEIEYRYFFSDSLMGNGQTQLRSEYHFKFNARVWKVLFNMKNAKVVQRHFEIFLHQLQKDYLKKIF